ncbi:MAG: hypothetical protein ACI4A8_08680 [Muribaculaceae bacterium]
MSTEKSDNEIKKTKVYNVIILDCSGSMSAIRSTAIDSFNETISGIKRAQEKHADTQEHFITLVTFCGCSIKHVMDMKHADKAKPITWEDYEPCCNTPLFDAIGITLTKVFKYVKDIEDYAVVVTIITDGYENASKEYSGMTIRKIIKKFRRDGWVFTYLGANQNSMEVAMELAIKNASDYVFSDNGFRSSIRNNTNTNLKFFSKLAMFKQDPDIPQDPNERRQKYATIFDKTFNEDMDDDNK